MKERSKKNESNIPKKTESSYKLPSHNKTPSMAKVEVAKNIAKVYPETTKENKEIQFTEGACYILNSHMKAKAESDKDPVQSSSTKLRSKFNTSSQKMKLNSSTNSSQELKSVTGGLFKRKITSESNNKENKEDQESRSKLSSSTAKSAGLQDSKGFRKAFDTSANKRSLNTSAQNKTEKSFQQSNPNRSFASINKSLSSIQTSKLEFPNKAAVANSEDLPIKKKINKRVMSVSKPKVENQSLVRSKTKSIDRNKEMKSGASRSRNVPNNFSSFNGTLTTEEEAEFMFKSYNALSRPRTATNVQNEESSYVLKGILSPKVNKSLIAKPTLNKTQKKPEKVAEQKAQPSNPNPLKFLNDLLNKRKISYSSSDHLRMPKKPTFLGKKNESPTSQIGAKPAKTMLKGDNFETKVSGHIKKGHSQSIANYISPTSSQKNLI